MPMKGSLLQDFPFLKRKAAAWHAAHGVEEISLSDNLSGFRHAVDWSEPWIVGMLCFYPALLLLAVLGRHQPTLQASLFFLTLGLAYSAETLNSLGNKHWKSFATQNYFDSRGVFASALFSAPLIFIAFVILLMVLYQNAQLLIKVKREQLMKDRRNPSERAQDVSESGPSPKEGNKKLRRRTSTK